MTHPALDGTLPPQPRAYDRLAGWLLFIPITAVTFLQKLAVPLGGNDALFLSLLILLGTTAVGAAVGRLQVDKRLLVTYCLAMSVLVAVQFANVQTFSVASLLLLLVVHAPYIFRLRPQLAKPGAELRFFQTVMAILAVCSVLQYVAQFAVGSHYAYFMDTLFPQAFIAQGFHALNPVGGGGTYKATAFFFLEPAVLCQFLAVSVVIEMLYFRSYRRLVLFFAGIAVTFSGTGLIILLVLAPIYLAAKRQLAILALIFVAIITAGIWMPLVGLEHTYERAFEFADPHASGFARFISIFLILRDLLLPQAATLFFGLGSGTISAAVTGEQFGYSAFDPTWGKIFFEYGLLGFMAYLALLTAIFSTGTRSRYLKAGFLIQFLLLGEFLLPPIVHCLVVALIVWPRSEEFSAEADASVEVPA